MRLENPRASTALNVLVVDDDSVSRTRVGALVRNFGHHPIEAATGELALEIFARGQIDIMLLDVLMPGINGFDVAARIKAAGVNRWTPIVFMSGLNERASRKRWTDLGDDYLAKPVDPQLLEARLRSSAMAILDKREAARIAREMINEQRLARDMMERISFRQRTRAFPCIETRMAAAGISSGDAIVVEGDADRIYLLVADAMGHGLAAAITLLPAVTIFRAMALKGFDPHQIVREINQKVQEMLPRGRFISAMVGKLDRQRHELQIFNAGLPPCLLLGPGGEVRTDFPSLCPPLGILEDAQLPAGQQVVPWQSGDRLLACTDGFTEPFGFSSAAMREVIRANFSRLSTVEAMDALWSAWSSLPASDDASLLLVRLDPIAKTPSAIPPELAPRHETLARITLLPAQLRTSPDADTVLALLSRLGLPWLETDNRIAVVMSELLSNAIDHGVLGLDSALKARGIDGFDAYYRLRAERLAALVEGEVTVEIRESSQAGLIDIEVRDSGQGFDLNTQAATAAATSSHPGAGRGLHLLQCLCERVEHRNAGRHTIATLRRTAPELQP